MDSSPTLPLSGPPDVNYRDSRQSFLSLGRSTDDRRTSVKITLKSYEGLQSPSEDSQVWRTDTSKTSDEDNRGSNSVQGIGLISLISRKIRMKCTSITRLAKSSLGFPGGNELGCSQDGVCSPVLTSSHMLKELGSPDECQTLVATLELEESPEVTERSRLHRGSN